MTGGRGKTIGSLRGPRPRLGLLVLTITLFAALAVGVTGALLISRSRAASVQALAQRQALLVDSRAHLMGEELFRLNVEMVRLSQLAEVDLADGNIEPEKRVLRIARRDSTLFSVAIAILDQHGQVVWSEPQGARPATPGQLLIQGERDPLQAMLFSQVDEIDLAAPIRGQGAIVAIVGEQGREPFGKALGSTLRPSDSISLIKPQDKGDFVVVLSGTPPTLALHSRGDGQQWLRDSTHARWLVTESRLPETELVLRLVQDADALEEELAGPLGRLVAILIVALLLAVAGGALLALALARLERARVELDKSRELAAMGKTAAAIAHEVKNSLNGISVAIDLLASGRAQPAAAREVHGQAREEVARLRGVADDLTLFAAPPMLQKTQVDLNDLCRRAVAAVAGRAAEYNVEVELELASEGEPILLSCDRHKLLGAVINVVQNGVEAMGPGAYNEELDATSVPGRVRRLLVKTHAAEHRVDVEIADTGAGISEEIRGKLFEPFVTTKRTGTGLGLAIARRVLEAHGGRIEAWDRAPDGASGDDAQGGAVFRLELPR